MAEPTISKIELNAANLLFSAMQKTEKVKNSYAICKIFRNALVPVAAKTVSAPVMPIAMVSFSMAVTVATPESSLLPTRTATLLLGTAVPPCSNTIEAPVPDAIRIRYSMRYIPALRTVTEVVGGVKVMPTGVVVKGACRLTGPSVTV